MCPEAPCTLQCPASQSAGAPPNIALRTFRNHTFCTTPRRTIIDVKKTSLFVIGSFYRNMAPTVSFTILKYLPKSRRALKTIRNQPGQSASGDLSDHHECPQLRGSCPQLLKVQLMEGEEV